MKSSIKGLFVILAIVMSFVLVQGVWAAEITVTGTIERIGIGSIDVDEDGVIYTFYHIPFTDLEEVGIFLEKLQEDNEVTISAYIVTFPNGEPKNIAYSITVGGTTYDWHPNVLKAGGITDSDSASAESEQGDLVCQNCNCWCPNTLLYCICDCSCDDCICDGDGPNGPKGPNEPNNP